MFETVLSWGERLVHPVYFGLVAIEGHGNYANAAAMLFGLTVLHLCRYCWDLRHKHARRAQCRE